MTNLWIGDYSSSQDTAELTKRGITHIVCASEFARERVKGRADVDEQ